MRQPIKLIVRKAKVRKDGTALISVQYCYSADQRVVLSTGVLFQFSIGIKKPEDYQKSYRLLMEIFTNLKKLLPTNFAKQKT